MKKQVKKLVLKKTTVSILGQDKTSMLGGAPLPTVPAPTCGFPCQPSVKNPCIPPPPR